jgi:hypothetical protein
MPPNVTISIWPDFTLAWLRKRGVSVPRDIGYLTFDLGDRIGDLADMQQNHRNLGAATMDLLASQLFRNEIDLPSTPALPLIESTWVDGPTVMRQDRATKRSGRQRRNP